MVINMSEYNNVPKIRFKGFTDVWEQRKLANLINEYKETVTSDCTLPVLTSSKVDGVVLQEEHFGRKQNHDITGYNILPYGYCTYRNRSDGIDFTFNINKCCKMGIISKFYPVFYGNKNNINLISIILNNSKEVAREIGYTCSGTGQKVLSFFDLQKMNIIIPNRSEQDKISDLFDNLDNLITLHQRKCDTLVNVKKSLLEKMFPKNSSNIPEIRFKGFTDVWEQRKLGDISFSYSGGTPNVGNNSYYGGSIPFIRSGEIKEKHTELFLTEEGFKNSSSKMVEKGDILYALYGATSGEVSISLINGAINQAILAIRPQCPYNNYFISQWLKKEKNNITSTYLQGGQGNLSGEIVKNLEINFPKQNIEQDKIGEIFTNLDNLITLHQRKLEKLNNIKKSMLDKMFV